jgi:TolB protein
VLSGSVGAQQVTRGDIEPAWSPDGKKIAFARLVGGHPQIFVMNANGGGVRALTHGAPDHLDPTWSPDGKTIAYSRLVRAPHNG